MEEDILLKLENVEICREENRVLHDACLTLRNGEFVYVIGKVGSGKSSLLKSLYCEIPILRGEARIMDYNLTKMKRKDIPLKKRSISIYRSLARKTRKPFSLFTCVFPLGVIIP